MAGLLTHYGHGSVFYRGRAAAMVVSDSRIEIREINKRMPWLVRLDNLPTLRTLAFAVVGIASVVLTQFHTWTPFSKN